MKKLHILLILFLSANHTLLALSDSLSVYRLSHAQEKVSLDFVQLLDPYLSPLEYAGSGIGYEHSEMKFFKNHIGKLSQESRISVLYALTQNPMETSNITYAGGKYSWGIHYHLRPLPDLHLLAGGNASALFAFKMNNRNVNNPINIDAAIDLNISGQANYQFNLWKKDFKIRYQLEFPLLGAMFVPMQGASYYEMLTVSELHKTSHFSSLHNRQGMSNALVLEIPLKHTVWQLGLQSDALRYEANNSFYKMTNISFILGYSYDLYIFSGTKNKAPHNFVTVY